MISHNRPRPYRTRRSPKRDLLLNVARRDGWSELWGGRQHLSSARRRRVGGLERVMTALTVRGALGPAFFNGAGGKGLGPMARVDLGTGFLHVAFVLVGQGELIIRSGETLRCGSIMFGVRIR
jgi:hypothetical protein